MRFSNIYNYYTEYINEDPEIFEDSLEGHWDDLYESVVDWAGRDFEVCDKKLEFFVANIPKFRRWEFTDL